MEGDVQTVKSREDALLTSKLNEGASVEVGKTIDSNEKEKNVESKVSKHTEISKHLTQTENDELLQKIEEVVKDETQSIDTVEDLNSSTEHDFLKKLSEIDDDKDAISKSDEVVENIAVVGDSLPKKDKRKPGSVQDSVKIDKSNNSEKPIPELLSSKPIEEKKQALDDTNKKKLNPDLELLETKKYISPDKKELSEKKCLENNNEVNSGKNSRNEPSTTKSVQDENQNSKNEEKIVPLLSISVEKLLKNDQSCDTEVENMSVDDDSNENAMEIDTDVKMDVDLCEENVIQNEEHIVKKDEHVNEKASKQIDSFRNKIEKNKLDTTSEKKELEKGHQIPDLGKFKKENKPESKNVDSVNVLWESEGKKSHFSDSTADHTDSEKKISIENKLLTNAMKYGGSTTSLLDTPVTSANVFNSTPIQKRFDISSEDVSKISQATKASRSEKTLGEDHNISSKSCQLSSKQDSTTSESGTGTTSEIGHNTSDGIKNYIKAIKQCNGLRDTTTDDDSTSTKMSLKKIDKSEFELVKANILSSNRKRSDQDNKMESIYEINVWYDEDDIKFLSVEKLETKKSSALLDMTSGESSEKSSSNGSVLGLPQFSLRPTRLTEMSSSGSTSTNSQKSLDGKFVIPTQPKKNKHIVKGFAALCTFMREHFTTKQNISEDHHQEQDFASSSKLKSSSRKPAKPKSYSPELAQTSSPMTKEKRAIKRPLNKFSDEDDDEHKSKAKQLKKSQTKINEFPSLKTTDKLDSVYIGCCVLAKWVDKKFYAGKISETRQGNKFVVLFEDGASKVLPKESIVFGQEDILPLKDHAVHALVGDDYERGLVTSYERIGDKVLYTVQAQSDTVKVTASDMYLQGNQAKLIQDMKKESHDVSGTSATDTSNKSLLARSTRNKRTSGSPTTPEAGYSGGVATKGGRRQKRIILDKAISESSDISDSPTTSETSLEAIEGVQPELQKTLKEAEISRLIMISDYAKDFPNSNIINIIGPLPESNTLFRNKHFLLSCTIECNVQRSTRWEFSKTPFTKIQLQKQLQAGEATVYQRFEDIPKNKYKQCKLIAARPITTARYVQCIAANIQPISHQWVIDSCNFREMANSNSYVLPAGWSILTKQYIRWAVGKFADQRHSNKPFSKVTIIIASIHKEFVTFWSRVCKLGGAIIRHVKSLADVTPTTTGYMVTEDDFPDVIKSKARHFGVPIVSTVWIVQSLILGKVCEPNCNEKLTQMFQDEDL